MSTTKPLLHPVLTLLKKPRLEAPNVRGPDASKIVKERIDVQRVALASALRSARSRTSGVYGGRILLAAQMFDDSFAPSYEPSGLLELSNAATLVAPINGGYLIDAPVAELSDIARSIETTERVAAQIAISRIRSIAPLGETETFAGHTVEDAWNEAFPVAGGRLFVVWLAPFRDNSSRRAVISAVRELMQAEIFTSLSLSADPSGRQIDSVARALLRYEQNEMARCTVLVPSISGLKMIAGSGASHRLEPIKPLRAGEATEGPEPIPATVTHANQPIVAIVDGGSTAVSYRHLEAWRARALVKDAHADHVHGNRITSLVVHAHAWNNKLVLPKLDCRFGVVQVVPRANAVGVVCNPEDLVDHLRSVAAAQPETKVWNMSFNQVGAAFDPEDVSFLGHEISRWARAAGVLPVISIGNVEGPGATSLSPPADCEAAITVAGRAHDVGGVLLGPCKISRVGPGPAGLMKPDLSWYSTLRTIGGLRHVGSSYSAAIVSSLAAHTFERLRSPTPDLVRALIIDTSDRDSHDPALGWGSPIMGEPWSCASGTVALAWNAKLIPGTAYYWEDIPIPAQMVQGDKLHGIGTLTAILEPLTSPTGQANYFSTRVQVALQYQNANMKYQNLLGSMQEDKVGEIEGRQGLSKWHPVRRHVRDFLSRGVRFAGPSLRLYARVFARDMYLREETTRASLGAQNVAFVLRLSDGSGQSGIYDTMVQKLGNFVESAVNSVTVEHTVE